MHGHIETFILIQPIVLILFLLISRVRGKTILALLTIVQEYILAPQEHQMPLCPLTLIWKGWFK